MARFQMCPYPIWHWTIPWIKRYWIIQKLLKLLIKKKKNAAPTEELSVEEVLSTVVKDNLPKTGKNASNTNKSVNGNAARLIKKADEYFNKMWYAEAAELYEEAIKKDANKYSLEIL